MTQMKIILVIPNRPDYNRRSTDWYQMFQKALHLYIIICLTMRETYIVFPFVYVLPSVRLYVTLSLSKPYLPESFVQKCLKKITINILTKVAQQKIQFCQKLLFRPKKTLFKLVFCPGHFSVNIKARDTGSFVVLAKTFPFCNVRINFAKCQMYVVYEQFLQFWFQRWHYFLYNRSCIFFSNSAAFLRIEWGT